MNLLADEGVDKQIVVRLREEGYSVSYVAEMAPGISDDIVLELAGCMADGKTYEEALKNAQIIIGEWIDAAKTLGRHIPEPKGKLAYA